MTSLYSSLSSLCIYLISSEIERSISNLASLAFEALTLRLLPELSVTFSEL